MERIVLRHLSGSKANQVEEFPLAHFQELTIGRDPSATVKYDPDRDDLVGRQHAKIVRDSANPNEFLITDVGSRNGTFVNKQRIVGTAKVVPGDLVQFGAGGQSFNSIWSLAPRIWFARHALAATLRPLARARRLQRESGGLLHTARRQPVCP